MESAQEIYYEVREGKIYLKPVLGQPEREIGEVMETEEKTVDYFREKFNRFSEKVDQLETTINENENKGSFLMKVVHLKNQLIQLNGIGDFEAILAKLNGIEENLNKSIEENRLKNLGHKQVLLEELESITSSHEYTQDTFNAVKEIQQKWIRVGRVIDERQEEFEERYQKAVDLFFAKRAEHLETKKLLIEARKDKYQTHIESAKKLLESKDFKNGGKAFKDLQKSWKEIGHIPAPLLSELWSKFKVVGDQYFDQLKKQSKAQGPRSAKEGLVKKEQIVQKAQEIYNISLEEGTQLAKELQKEWKNSGFVKKEKQQELYDELMKACDYIFEYRFVKSLSEKKNKNFDQKTDEEKASAMRKILHNLIQRDQDEVDRIEENSFNLSFKIDSDSTFSKVVDSRISGQKRKLEVKKRILNELKKGQVKS